MKTQRSLREEVGSTAGLEKWADVRLREVKADERLCREKGVCVCTHAGHSVVAAPWNHPGSFTNHCRRPEVIDLGCGLSTTIFNSLRQVIIKLILRPLAVMAGLRISAPLQRSGQGCVLREPGEMGQQLT